MARYVKKYATVYITSGASRALIYDSNKKTYVLIPNSLVDFIHKLEGHTYEETLRHYREDDQGTVEEYYHFLIDNDFIFHCESREELNRFPEMDTSWEYPATITNAVVEIYNTEDIARFHEFKKNHFIPYLQYTILSPIESTEQLKTYFDHMLDDSVKGIQVHFDNSIGFSEKELTTLCNNTPRLETLVAFNSKINSNHRSSVASLYLVQGDYRQKHHCGLVAPEYFNLQLAHYTESLHHNTCLNRKMSVDINGDIRNCPSMSEAFGNISDTTFMEVLEHTGFKKFWNVTKDQISTCRECEFRHICTDCRAYLESPDDDYSKPLKCGYNPFTCEWEDWSTHPMKLEAIAYYGLSNA